MGKSVVADDSVEKYIAELVLTKQWHIGLIVGLQTASKDFVVRLMRTPDPVEDEVSEEEEGEEVEKKRKNIKNRPKSLEHVDEKWIITHVKQVRRMLPGGLDVIGIFVMSPPNMLLNAQVKFRQLVFSTFKHVKCVADDTDTVTDRIILQICSTSRKTTCRTIDVRDMKSQEHPAEFRYQALLDRWTRINALIAINLCIPVEESAHESLAQQIQQGISKHSDLLRKAPILFNGVLRDPKELVIRPETHVHKGKSKDRQLVKQQILYADILMPLTAEVIEPVMLDLKSVICVKGQMVGRAFVNSKATIHEAEHAVRTDIIRSLTSRCELLCEDIDVVEEDGIKELYNTPVRVFVALPHSTLDLCDYIFQDEKIAEVCDRMKELLDIDVNEDTIEFECERPGSTEDLFIPESSQELICATAPANKLGFQYTTVAVIGGTISAIIGLYYYYIS